MHRLANRLFAACVAVLPCVFIPSRASAQSDWPTTPLPGVTPGYAKIFDLGNGSPFGDKPHHGLIRSDSAWRDFWRRSWKAGEWIGLDSIPPQIDFRRFMLIVVAAGSPGHTTSDVAT